MIYRVADGMPRGYHFLLSFFILVIQRRANKMTVHKNGGKENHYSSSIEHTQAAQYTIHDNARHSKPSELLLQEERHRQEAKTKQYRHRRGGWRWRQ